MKKGKSRRLTKSIISFILAVVLFFGVMPPASVKAGTDFKWLGKDGIAHVTTGFENATGTGGKWFVATDNADDGNSTVVWDDPYDVDPDAPINNAHVQANKGISGTAMLDDGGKLTYNPYVDICFSIVGQDEGGELVACDASDWGGLSVYYECDYPATLLLGMETDTEMTISYANPECSLPKAPTGEGGVLKNIPWSGFSQPAWYHEPTKINGSEAAAQLAYVKFKIQAPTGSSYHFKIKGIGSYNALSNKVTFNTDGGSAIEAQYVIDGEKAVKPANPTKAGCTFAGWYADSELTIPFDFNNVIAAETTVYAKWTDGEAPATYTVSFETNGGSAIGAQNIISGAKAEEPTPTKEGFSFAGWYSDSTLNTKFDFNTPITADIVLYAKWIENSYIVTFNSNGGSAVANQTVEIGGKAVKPTNPTKEGFTFAGWYTDSTFNTAFDFNSTIEASITLYAKWTAGNAPTVYTVSFETNGGSAIGAQNITSGEKAAKPADPTKSGSIFGGWYSDSALTTEFSFDTPITADTVIYAKWNPVKTSVALKDSSITLKMGESKKLDATVTPDNAADKSLSWTSADTAVAIVDADGTVTAVKPGETTITATCNSGGEKAECKVVVERKSVGDDDSTTRISDMDIDAYVIPSFKSVSVNFTAKLSKTETVQGTVGFNYLDAISYTGKKISPDMLKAADAELINLSGVLKAAGIRETVKAEDVLNVKYTSSKNKDAGEAKFYAKLSVKKGANNVLNKTELSSIKKVVAAANKELKKKDNRIKYTINPVSLADMSSVEVVAKTNSDGSFKIKDGSLSKIKSVKVKFKATDEKLVKLTAKMYFTSNAKEDGTVKINGKKNYTGCVTVQASAQ